MRKHLAKLPDMLGLGLCIFVIELGNLLTSETLNLWDRLNMAGSQRLEHFETAVVVVFYSLAFLAIALDRIKGAKALLGVLCVWTLIDLSNTVALLISSLAMYKQGPGGNQMLWDGILLWVLNVLTCAIIYWLLDSRHWNLQPGKHLTFPRAREEDWKETFFDYVFFAFTVSTAYSPTDTAVRTSVLKGLVMVQSTVSLLAFTIIIARAVNIVG